MIRKKFVNRREELCILERCYKRRGFEFVVITGRRRVGKSRLLEEFLKNKPSIYLLCENRPYFYNLRKFSKIISEYFNLPEVTLNSLRDCFELITKIYKEGKKLVIVIDEFSYLVKQNSEVVAEMQSIVDEILKDKNIMLVLSGSAVSLMQKELLTYSSPLYGRTTANIFLKPLSFDYLSEWFPKNRVEELIKIFSVADGIPKYLEFFEGRDVEKEIKENFFNPHSFLFREMIQIISEELRNTGLYISILEAISKGKNKVVEIANYAYIKASEVTSYLNILQNIGLVKRIVPLFGKKGIYDIADNYTRFWFNFVSPHYSEIEEGFADNALNDFEKNFNLYLGRIFENLILRLIRSGFVKLPISFTKIGRWWHKDNEIDIVALNESTKQILFAECKWQSNVNAKKITKELAEKSKYVDWCNEERKEYFAIFAKSFSKKIDEYKGRKVFCYDLRDLERIS